MFRHANSEDSRLSVVLSLAAVLCALGAMHTYRHGELRWSSTPQAIAQEPQQRLQPVSASASTATASSTNPPTPESEGAFAFNTPQARSDDILSGDLLRIVAQPPEALAIDESLQLAESILTSLTTTSTVTNSFALVQPSASVALDGMHAEPLLVEILRPLVVAIDKSKTRLGWHRATAVDALELSPAAPRLVPERKYEPYPKDHAATRWPGWQDRLAKAPLADRVLPAATVTERLLREMLSPPSLAIDKSRSPLRLHKSTAISSTAFATAVPRMVSERTYEPSENVHTETRRLGWQERLVKASSAARVPSVALVETLVSVDETTKKQKPPFLGVAIRNTSTSRVTGIYPNSSAEKAGLRVGDVILAVASTPVDDFQSLVRAIARFSAGNSVEVVVRRGGRSVTLGPTRLQTRQTTGLLRR